MMVFTLCDTLAGVTVTLTVSFLCLTHRAVHNKGLLHLSNNNRGLTNNVRTIKSSKIFYQVTFSIILSSF